jgi:hypothetical protein
MSEQPREPEPCVRCGGLAELPALAEGQVAGEQVERLPICTACIELLLADPEQFWRPLRERRQQ